MKKVLISLGSFASLALPTLALAAEFKTDYIDSVLTGGSKIIQTLVIFLVGLAVVWFMWNVIKYAMSNEEDGKDKAKTQMIHGIIAIAVTVSIWGIVGILRSTFGVGNSQAPQDINNMIPGGSSQSAAPSSFGGGSTNNTYQGQNNDYGVESVDLGYSDGDFGVESSEF